MRDFIMKNPPYPRHRDPASSSASQLVVEWERLEKIDETDASVILEKLNRNPCNCSTIKGVKAEAKSLREKNFGSTRFKEVYEAGSTEKAI
ncbi:hypothetical protein V3C99_001935 [Haemonchus contortus]